MEESSLNCCFVTTFFEIRSKPQLLSITFDWDVRENDIEMNSFRAEVIIVDRNKVNLTGINIKYKRIKNDNEMKPKGDR